MNPKSAEWKSNLLFVAAILKLKHIDDQLMEFSLLHSDFEWIFNTRISFRCVFITIFPHCKLETGKPSELLTWNLISLSIFPQAYLARLDSMSILWICEMFFEPRNRKLNYRIICGGSHLCEIYTRNSIHALNSQLSIKISICMFSIVASIFPWLFLSRGKFVITSQDFLPLVNACHRDTLQSQVRNPWNSMLTSQVWIVLIWLLHIRSLRVMELNL